MPSIPLYPTKARKDGVAESQNALPNLLQTPSGLAILEIQGTIHAPFPEQPESDNPPSESVQTPIGRIHFPLYNPQDGPEDTQWMKKVYLYIGKHQRLTGEVKKLPKAFMVVGKRAQGIQNDDTSMDIDEQQSSEEDLEILEIIKYKILFGGRPEPVGE